MKKISIVLTLVTISAAPAWAGGKNNQGGNAMKSGHISWSQGGQNGNKLSPIIGAKLNHERIKPQGITAPDLVANNSTKLPVGPSRGDGRVPLTTTSVPTKPGFIWAGDHWERTKSNSSGPGITNHVTGNAAVGALPLNPVPGFEGLANNPPPLVLNPTITPPSSGPFNNHGNRFESGPSGGVSISVRPGSQRESNVTGSGGTPIDAAISTIAGSTQWHNGVLPPPSGVRDHRTAP